MRFACGLVAGMALCVELGVVILGVRTGDAALSATLGGILGLAVGLVMLAIVGEERP